MTSGTTQSQSNKKVTKSTITDDQSTSAFKTPVMLRANFYRDNYRLLIYVCLLLSLVIIGLLAWLGYERTHKAQVRYFATTNEGKLIPLVPLNQPNLTSQALSNWVVRAATSAYNFGFGNYETALRDAKIYFTEAGYQHFLNALNNAKTIETIKSKQLIVIAVATEEPVVVKEGPTSDGIYAWQVQLPLLLTYQSSAEQIKQNVILTMIIARRPVIESPEGIGIASIAVKVLS